MVSYSNGSLLFSLLLFVLLGLSSFISSLQSYGVPHFPPFQTLPASVLENEVKQQLGSPQEMGPRRFLEEDLSDEDEPVEGPSLVLAARRTRRKDPLNGFKIYTKGWNISERHYWASVGFTAISLFAVAAVWFLCVGLSLLFISLCYFCCERQPHGYSRTCYALSLVLLVLFTFASIIGCGVLYIGQGRFHHSTRETLEYVVSQADFTTGKLRNVSDYLATAKQTGIDKVFLPSNVQSDIDEIGAKLNSSASTLADQTRKKSDDIQDLLDSVRLALIVIAATMLLLTFLGCLFSIFGMQLLVYILVITGWLLVTGTFILCGTFLLLHNVAADTCVAMEEWVQYPATHTALDEILPCVDNATAQETLLRNKEVTLELVDLINEVITNVSNINFAPNFVPMYFNQSGPLVPLLCNPFHHDLTNRACSSGEVDLINATEVWGSYICQVSASGICTTQGRLTPDFYNQMSFGVNVAYALYNYAPFLIDLQDCTFVRQTFDDVSRDYCPSLRRYSQWIYVGLLIASIAVMLSLIFWLIYGRERQHRIYTKQLPADATEGDKDRCGFCFQF